MMKLSALFDSKAFFRSDTEIKQWIRQSKNYNNENLQSTDLLIFFSTSKQRTYLVATKKRLYCILDDSRKDSPHLNWSMSINNVVDSDGLLFSITAKDKSKATGLVDISNKHKNWLFSKDLFVSKNIEESMKAFIVSTMCVTQ
ncbi:MAG: hypothetical protein JKY93_05075 [Gammaproteobacteria bacterium]|nr:hypothetical protein [Gammaproteobacteria bacterium]